MANKLKKTLDAKEILNLSINPPQRIVIDVNGHSSFVKNHIDRNDYFSRLDNENESVESTFFQFSGRFVKQ